jgi:hypothetical protein
LNFLYFIEALEQNFRQKGGANLTVIWEPKASANKEEIADYRAEVEQAKASGGRVIVVPGNAEYGAKHAEEGVEFMDAGAAYKAMCDQPPTQPTGTLRSEGAISPESAEAAYQWYINGKSPDTPTEKVTA